MKKVHAIRVADSIGNTDEPQCGAFEIVKLVRVHVPVHGSPVYGKPYGELLDDMLREAFHNGDEIQEITLHIDWQAYAEQMKGN